MNTNTHYQSLHYELIQSKNNIDIAPFFKNYRYLETNFRKNTDLITTVR